VTRSIENLSRSKLDQGMSIVTNIESQNLVYKYLGRSDVLYEFLLRAYLNLLGKHIQDDIIALEIQSI
jgi:hypothetical protein